MYTLAISEQKNSWLSFFFLRRRWNPLDRQREEEKVYTHKNSNKLKTVVVRLHSVLVQKASLLVFFSCCCCYCCLIMRNNDADKKFIRSTLRTSSLFVSKLLHSSFFPFCWCCSLSMLPPNAAAVLLCVLKVSRLLPILSRPYDNLAKNLKNTWYFFGFSLTCST